MVNRTKRERGAEALGPDERRVLRLAAAGLTDLGIADEMGIPVSTLRNRWLLIRGKLGAANRAHAVGLAAAGAGEAAPDLRERLAAALARDRVSSWVCLPRSDRALLDPAGERLFGLPARGGEIALDELLGRVWRPDRERLGRYLRQAHELRAMTPIEARAGAPGEYRSLLRTVNAAAESSPEPAVVLLTTLVHTFDP